MSNGTSNKDKLRLIQAGVGGHGGSWINNTSSQSDDFELVAIVDPNAETLQAAGDKNNVPAEARFATLAEAVKSVKADALLSATPPQFHPSDAQLAFEHGLHLLVEKPMAEDLASAKTMVQQADDAGLHLMVSQNRRWDAEPQALAAIVEEEPLGKVDQTVVQFFMPGDFRGSFRQTMKHVLLVDMVVHHIDMIRFVLNRDIERVYAEDWNTRASKADSLYEDGAALSMILTLTGGAKVMYTGDWSAKGKVTSWQGDWRLQCEQGSVIFEGEAGDLQLSRSEMWGQNVQHERREIRQPAMPSQAASLAAFAKSIRTGKPAMTSGRDNLKTLAAVFAAVESCETGKAVDVVLG